MQTQGTAPGTLPLLGIDRRWLTYGATILLILAPVVIFALLGINASSDQSSLKGSAGPLLAYSAGVLSFVSPCVLPIVPIYLTNIAGGVVEGGKVAVERGKMITHAIAFLIGLSAVFILLGSSAGLLGYFLDDDRFFLVDNSSNLELGAGILMILMGVLIVPGSQVRSAARSVVYLAVVAVVFFAVVSLADIADERGRVLLLGAALLVAWIKLSGLVQFSLLSRTVQVNVGQNRKVGYTRSTLLGGAFATGWTPCLGPILGGILTIAATSGEGLTGAYLLSAYSLGFAMPFLLTAVAFSDATVAIRRVQRFLPWFEVASALMLIGLGLLLVTGRVTALNGYFDFGIMSEGL